MIEYLLSFNTNTLRKQVANWELVYWTLDWFDLIRQRLFAKDSEHIEHWPGSPVDLTGVL